MLALLRKVLVALLLVGLSVSATLVVLEVAIRSLKPQTNMAVGVNTWNSELGTHHAPGARGFVCCPEYDIELNINSRGLRDREFSCTKPDGTRRILCLGDSFVCGYGVDAHETFAKVLEERLTTGDSTTRWEVLNAGVGSTGTAHQLAYFEDEGYKYDPDIVILGFCPANDFWDNMNSGLYCCEGGQLVRQEARLDGHGKVERAVGWIPGHRTVFARSHLMNLIRYRVARHHFQQLARENQQPDMHREGVRKSNELTRHLLTALGDACSGRGCSLVVMVVPAVGFREPRGRTDDLLAYLRDQEIPVLEVAPAFQAAMRQGLRTHYRQDRHWTREGHELAAGILYGYLQENMIRGTPGREVTGS